MATILVTGSRHWTDRAVIHEALRDLLEGTLVVHGANGRYDKDRGIYIGADLLCEQYALVHGHPVKRYPVSDADWKAYGLSAGPRRNLKMYQETRPDEVVAFRLYGKSSGTDGMVKIALAGHTPVRVCHLALDGTLSRFAPGDWVDYCHRVGRNP